jgi:hypothetical protein
MREFSKYSETGVATNSSWFGTSAGNTLAAIGNY